MITKEMIEQGTPHQVLSHGLRWVAIRGVISDWAVYRDNDVTIGEDIQKVIDIGTKIYDSEFLKTVVQANSEALDLYRE